MSDSDVGRADASDERDGQTESGEHSAPQRDPFDIDPSTVAGPLEALLLMATEPMGTAELAQALDVPKPVVWEALDELRTFYDETNRGFELREVGQGWRYYTRVEHHDVIARWLLEGQHGRLSQAALETLAVVAYLQPISRSRVSAVRGVNVDGVMRTLVTRELIEEGERDPDSGAMRFVTTDHFLERMGMTSLDDLTAIAPFLPEASALEAELNGLAARADLGEDGDMSEQINENEVGREPADAEQSQGVPTADQAREWADEQASERLTKADLERPGVDDESLDRLSDPE